MMEGATMSVTDELRTLAKRMDGLVPETPDMLREAADEIDQLVMKLNAEHLVRQNVERENAKLREWIREAVRFMGCVTECDAGGWAVWMDELVEKARELGVDA